MSKPQRLDECRDGAVLRGVLARRTRGDPAANAGVPERLREVPESEARAPEYALEVRAHDACLHRCRCRLTIDFEYLAQGRHIDSDRRTLSHWLDAANDRSAAAERDHGQPAPGSETQDGKNLLLIARPHDGVSGVRDVTAPHPDEILVALAEAKEGAILAISRDRPFAGHLP
jgi:hypothetical protein